VTISTGCMLLDSVSPKGAVAGRAVHETVLKLHRILPNDPAGKETWVLQEHIPPMLHEGRKFHLRMLLLCIGDLQAYLHDDVRLLLATARFEVGACDSSQTSALVTNMGASSACEGYDAASQNLPLSVLGAQVADRLLREAAVVLGSTLAKVRAGGRRQFFSTANCWELFGVDVLVEATSKRVIVLEVNPSPSLAMYGGPHVRPQLVGENPLEGGLPVGWRAVPIRS